jgi:hypothetical protein
MVAYCALPCRLHVQLRDTILEYERAAGLPSSQATLDELAAQLAAEQQAGEAMQQQAKAQQQEAEQQQQPGEAQLPPPAAQGDQPDMHVGLEEEQQSSTAGATAKVEVEALLTDEAAAAEVGVDIVSATPGIEAREEL